MGQTDSTNCVNNHYRQTSSFLSRALASIYIEASCCGALLTKDRNVYLTQETQCGVHVDNGYADTNNVHFPLAPIAARHLVPPFGAAEEKRLCVL
jgi:hypothetical protein